jgi:hypothetical protein
MFYTYCTSGLIALSDYYDRSLRHPPRGMRKWKRIRNCARRRSYCQQLIVALDDQMGGQMQEVEGYYVVRKIRSSRVCLPRFLGLFHVSQMRSIFSYMRSIPSAGLSTFDTTLRLDSQNHLKKRDTSSSNATIPYATSLTATVTVVCAQSTRANDLV